MMEFTLDSGAKLSVTPAPFVDAMALQKALLSSVKGVPLSEDILKMDVTVLKDAIIAAATSPDVEAALFRCGKRALYNNAPVESDLFDNVSMGERAREDFYDIAIKIVEVNCGPFFKKTFSRLKGTFPGKPTASPAQ